MTGPQIESAIPFGFQAHAYYNSAATHAAPTWTPMCSIQDLTLNNEVEAADVTTRCGLGFKQYAAGLKDVSIDTTYLTNPNDANSIAVFAMLEAMYFGGYGEEFLFLDGPITSTGTVQGLDAPMILTKFNRKEELNGPIVYELSFKPCQAGFAPQWLTFTNGTTSSTTTPAP